MGLSLGAGNIAKVALGTTEVKTISVGTQTVWTSAVVLPAIGAAFMGGYYAGIVDTTKGNIIAADASQTGLRYALIVGPKSLETGLAYKTANTAAPAASRTRWDGLAATTAMTGTTYPAANYCNGLTYAADGASQWYLPALDEFELIYRNLKPTTETNLVYTASGGTFPGGSQPSGYAPSLDPAGVAHTAGSPAQTGVALFKSGGAQCLNTAGSYYRTATEYSTSDAWLQSPSGGDAGANFNETKTFPTRIRPVRRVLL